MQTATMNDVDANIDAITDAEDSPDDLGKEEQKSRFILLRAKGNGYAWIKEIAASISAG